MDDCVLSLGANKLKLLHDKLKTFKHRQRATKYQSSRTVLNPLKFVNVWPHIRSTLMQENLKAHTEETLHRATHILIGIFCLWHCKKPWDFRQEWNKRPPFRDTDTEKPRTTQRQACTERTPGVFFRGSFCMCHCTSICLMSSGRAFLKRCVRSTASSTCSFSA